MCLLALFYRVVEDAPVVVGANRAKHGMFTVAERVAMLEEVTKDLPNVSVGTFRGLLVEYCRAQGVSAIVKGLRAVSDFEYEMEMAGMNERMASDLQTVFLPASPGVRPITATLVRQIASMGGDVSPFVPPQVAVRLQAKFAGKAGR